MSNANEEASAVVSRHSEVVSASNEEASAVVSGHSEVASASNEVVSAHSAVDSGASHCCMVRTATLSINACVHGVHRLSIRACVWTRDSVQGAGCARSFDQRFRVDGRGEGEGKLPQVAHGRIRRVSYQACLPCVCVCVCVLLSVCVCVLPSMAVCKR